MLPLRPPQETLPIILERVALDSRWRGQEAPRTPTLMSDGIFQVGRPTQSPTPTPAGPQAGLSPPHPSENHGSFRVALGWGNENCSPAEVQV
jgi:hypothetical protein